jgi:uncharacterized protein (TIGR02246 family)
MSTERINAWMEQYIKAWNSNDPDDVGSLFCENALYYTGPFAEPWRGRAKIVETWLDHKDVPGSFTFRYEVLASSPELGIVRGWTQYSNPTEEFSNIWLVRFDKHGCCKEFTEWWMERKAS